MKPAGRIPAGFIADSAGRLLIGARPAAQLVEEAGGTPLFVYDRGRVAAQVERFRGAMPPGLALHYAVKANPYHPLLGALAGLVDGFDIASLGELEALDAAGAASLPTSFAGPGKRDSDLESAIVRQVTINLESEGEAGRALAIAERLGVQPRLAVRVNPPFALKGAAMRMGGQATQFGVDDDRAASLVRRLLNAGADWRGLHIFAGSQALGHEALADAQRRSVGLAARIAAEADAVPLEVNLGGGFGISYFSGDEPLDVEAVGAALGETLAGRPAELGETRFALELGRWLVGEAGVYLTRIIDRKESRGRIFLVTDGGLHHQLAASGNFGQLLRRNYPLAIADRFGAAADEVVSVTGCLCTPLDLLGDQLALPGAAVGDLVAIFCAGAYGLTASPQAFLGQPAAREMLV